MKKALVLVLCVMVAMVMFAACAQPAAEEPAASDDAATSDAPAADDTAADDTAADDTAATGESYTIGYLAWSLSDEWNSSGKDNFVWNAENLGWEVIVEDSQGDAEKQVSQAEALINQGVDMLTVFPSSTESAQTIIRMANEAGIPIAVENSFMSDDAGDIVGQIACQYADIGYAAIKWAAENVEDAKLLYVHGAPGLGVYEDYAIGVEQALKDFSDSVEEVGLINGEWETEASYTVTNDFIKAGTAEFNVVFANNDLQAQGVYQALKENGMEDIPIISTGGSSAGKELFEQGVEAANMTAPVSIQGAQLFKFCYQYLTGKEIPETKIPLAVIPVDNSNPDDWMDWHDYQAALDYIGGLDG